MSLSPVAKSIILFPMNILYEINKPLTLRILYRLKQKRRLDLKDPKTYTEKLQWEKLYYKNPILPKLVDKYCVREYVGKKCPELLVKLLWQGFSSKEIPWKDLPDKFIIKVTHGSGMNIICDKSKGINKEEIERKLNKWLKTKFIKCYGEWFYGVEKPRIIIEEFLNDGSGKAPTDFKVMCFSRKPKCIVVDTDRFTIHKRNIYDTKWNFYKGVTFGFPTDKPIVPVDKVITERLLNYARILSDGFPHVRVDLYIIGDKIYFGELTFTNGAGFDRLCPYKFDKKLGDYFVLEKM